MTENTLGLLLDAIDLLLSLGVHTEVVLAVVLIAATLRCLANRRGTQRTREAGAAHAVPSPSANASIVSLALGRSTLRRGRNSCESNLGNSDGTTGEVEVEEVKWYVNWYIFRSRE